MTNIKVAVRIRPLSERELSQRGTLPVVKAENKNVVTVTNIKVAENNAGDSRDRIRRFAFDYCFGQTTTQTEVYDVIGNDVMSAVTSKYNLCVLAYGQSASGKTYTMMGSQKSPGLTQRICKSLFKQWGKCNQTIRVTASFLEIYNERVQDLLGLRRPGEEPTVPLKVREHPKTGPYVQGLTEHEVKDADELLELVRRGDGARSVAATLSNRQSSRSHSVLTVACADGTSSSTYIPTSGSGHLVNKPAATRLYLVDLAGSERANSCVQDNARRLKEGANINRSLVALGNVISALAENNLDKVKSSWKRYVPYRDSVLTWLLKDTLGGNSKTIMIATVSPSSSCYSETVNTLRFGQRAKKIVNQPVINEDPNTRIIRELQEEVARLKKLLTEHQISENPVESNIETKSDTTEAANDDNRIKIKEGTDSATITDEYDCASPLEEVTSNRYEAKAEVGCNISGVVIKTDTLIPFMNVSSSVLPTTESNLRRTFSDYELHTLNSFIRPKFGSQETLTSTVINCNAKRESGRSGVSGSRTRLHSCTEKSLDLEKCSALNGSFSDTTFSDSKTPPKLNTSRGSIGSLTTEAQKVQPAIGNAPVKEAIKKHNIEKRSQIVSSVTERLYSTAKLKRKDSTFDSSHRSSSSSVTSEMSICSNERNRLHDLTLRALNASRRYRKKPILVMNETQTDPERVVRVKEVATDVPYDILNAVQLAKDVSTQIVVSQNHIAVGSDNSATFDCQPQVNATQPKTFIVTRSCGNMTVECNDQQTKDGGNEVLSNLTNLPQKNPYSFTKYINYNQRKSNIKTISFAIPQYEPVYTTSVNINLNCNVTELRNGDDSLSDDSLDGGQMQTGDNYQIVSLPTPDLLSNHNSLENSSTVINDDKNMVPSTTDNMNVLENICHANEISIIDDFKNVEYIHIPKNDFHYADTIFETSDCNGVVTTTCISTIQLNRESDFSDEEEDISLPRSTGCKLENTKSWPEFKNIILGKNKNIHPYNIDLDEFYKKDDFEKSSHKITNKNVTWADSVTEKCIPEDEPYIKPILKSCNKTYELENDKFSRNFENSCEDNACKDNNELALTMSNFLKEVSSLISNLNTATKYFDECSEDDKIYECSVTINNVESILTDNFKTELVEKTLQKDICKIEKSVQTEQNRNINTIEESTNTDQCLSIEILNNKWEKSLEESCLRLEHLTQNNFQSLRKSNKDYELNLSASDVSFSSVESIEASTSKSFNENKTNIEHKKTNLKRYEPSTNLNKYNGSYTFSNFKSPREYLQTLMNARRQVIEQSRELLAMSENNDINS